MQEITLKISQDQLNIIQSALNAFVLYNQQSAAILAGSIQSQVNAQIPPVLAQGAPPAVQA